jgi:PleD family two-component response regulator
MTLGIELTSLSNQDLLALEQQVLAEESRRVMNNSQHIVVEADAPQEAHSAAIKKILERRKPIVMVVDDSISVRELLSTTLSKAGFRVIEARNGLDALEKLHSGLPCDPDFVDIEIPQVDGMELLSQLQQDPDLQNLPITILIKSG